MAKKAKHVSKYKTAEEKRQARNARVRLRRAKQRAAKRAAKASKKDRRGIPRRAADFAAIAPPPLRTLALMLIGARVMLVVNGVELADTVTFHNDRVKQDQYVLTMQSVAMGLGADFRVVDLRPAE